jgi:hypothetical protein
MLALKQLPLIRGRREHFGLRWYADELAHFFFEWTGGRPKRSYDAENNRDTGRFLHFVRAALAPVDPDAAKGGAHVVRLVCDKFDPKAPWGIFRH